MEVADKCVATIAEDFCHYTLNPLATTSTNSPENYQCNPENYQCNPENYQCNPENYQQHSENHQCNPENYQQHPENYQHQHPENYQQQHPEISPSAPESCPDPENPSLSNNYEDLPTSNVYQQQLEPYCVLGDDRISRAQMHHHHNTCLEELAQLQAVLNTLVENKVQAIKSDAKSAALRSARYLGVSRALVRRLRRRGKDVENKDKDKDEGNKGRGAGKRRRDRREKRVKERLAGEDEMDDGGGESGRNGRKEGRSSKQRICSTSTNDSGRYNLKTCCERTPQISDEDAVFINCDDAPCCCDTAEVHPFSTAAFDSDYISVNIDAEESTLQPPHGEVDNPEHHQQHTEDLHHHHYHQEELDAEAEAEAARRARSKRRRRRRRRRKRKEAAAAAAAHMMQTYPYLMQHRAVELEVEDVRVMDPDELSRKARLTIAATACLLLFMCLLLVGVTLRMAPLIDDMVREQNRNMLKSLQREAPIFLNNTQSISTNAV